MIFTLKNYNDLGRCSYGTLMESFDTEKDEIFVNGKKVEIRSVSDLFPYLWQSAGSCIHCDGKSSAYFYSHGTHWHHDYDKSIAEHHEKAAKLYNKMIKTSNDAEKINIGQKYNAEVESYLNLESIVNRLDDEMKEQQKNLIEENSVKRVADVTTNIDWNEWHDALTESVVAFDYDDTSTVAQYLNMHWCPKQDGNDPVTASSLLEVISDAAHSLVKYYVTGENDKKYNMYIDVDGAYTAEKDIYSHTIKCDPVLVLKLLRDDEKKPFIRIRINIGDQIF